MRIDDLRGIFELLFGRQDKIGRVIPRYPAMAAFFSPTVVLFSVFLVVVIFVLFKKKYIF